ncbi:MAG: hypothetical protein J7559_23805, partial [Cohnella sp.]|nr:hypothetical protein [Cohnella sp.]
MALKVGKRIWGMCFALIIMLPSFQGAEAASNPTGLEARMVLDLTDDIELPNSHVGGLAGNGEYYLYVKYSDLSFHRSEDGLRWTRVSITEATYQKFHGIPRQLIWDGQQFVLLLDSQILTSSDGRDWKDVTPAHPDRTMEYTFEDIHFANGQYVILAQDRDRNVGGFYVEGDNTIFYGKRLSELKKAKKQDFMEVAGGRERPLDHVIWTGSGYLAGGNGVAYSADGKVWRGDAGLGYGYNAVWDGKRVWDADGDRILSYDAKGKSAKSVYKLTKETAKKVNLKVIGANGRSYIAAGKSGKNAPTTVMYSKDGAKWSTVMLGTEPSDIHSILPTPYGYLLAGDRIWYVSETAIDQPSTWAVPDVERAVKDKLVTPAVKGFYQYSLARQDLSILSVKLYEAMT